MNLFRTLGSAAADAPVRLRFAPSPTGFLHLGGLRTALFNHLLARSLGGKWLLRIEDTDRARFVDGATQSIIETLRWAKLDYDEGPDRPGEVGPYIQSQRQALYKTHRDRLLQSKHAYRCFCSAERLDQMRQSFRRSGSNLTYDRRCLQMSEAEQARKMAEGAPHVIRLRNSDAPVRVNDLVYGQLAFPNNSQDDAILVKADGSPTYHFANVVDDHHMGISHIMRGEEWLSSTPKHILLYNALGFPLPQFAHLPLLVNADGSKLSKRSGDVRVEEYMTKGYEPEALLNFVALMGMDHSRHGTSSDESIKENGARDVMTMEEMVSAFSIEAISKHRATMSHAKLVHLNQQHIAQSLVSADPAQVQPWLARARAVLLLSPDDTSDAYVLRVLLALKDRLHVFHDIKYLAEYFFRLPDLASSEAREMRKTIPDDLYHEILLAVDRVLGDLEHTETAWTLPNIAAALKLVVRTTSSAEEAGNSKRVMGTLRQAITGRKIGPAMAETIHVLGKTRTLDRIRNALQDQ
ncbi:hypothetical protein PCANC_10008 [Puccinia coronata f. sp. avenae]|uniref:Glutamate--tRNA ligase, mitochondrial n=1 Tax=Puccinia coronata f. sp. avenae TaxID=200324 RepID=A0A2N5TWK8_9BASI|nr:hypothetical protein PCASD_16809 [Puccinia coronata f. sp. avenae]PLW29869.1 hypothetical protein PCANC_22542 [Puccinia coronata f. sp. avenae]PLW43025.1 hypothetical protein PCANC_10008 [Puccinia coronata f. sp. avenae]